MTEPEATPVKPKKLRPEGIVFIAAVLAVGVGVGAALSWGWGLAVVGGIVLLALVLPEWKAKTKGKTE